MDKASPFYLHHNRGVPKLAFSVRQDRQIKLVKTAPFNKVLTHKPSTVTLIVTKGMCAEAVRQGRLKLVPYTGKWPVLTLLWTRFMEVVRDV